MSGEKLSVLLFGRRNAAIYTGDMVYISGSIFTVGYMAHLKIKSLLDEGKPLSKNFDSVGVFHVGLVALKNDDGSFTLNVIGFATGIRTEPVGELDVRAVIGKGGMDRV